MKKLILIFALSSFVAFSVLGLQNVTASSTSVELVRFDKDPKKASEKKVVESKDKKTSETKTVSTEAKVNASTSKEKSAASNSCSDKDKAGCCSSSPDKK